MMGVEKSVQRLMCKGKIHRATVTEADLNYEGSITIDALLMKASNIRPFEMVQVTNLSNATLWRTYAIPAPEGSGKIGLNGPPARLFQSGDLVVILSMAFLEEADLQAETMNVVLVDESNRILQVITHSLDDSQVAKNE